jgi:hypothetical protein
MTEGTESHGETKKRRKTDPFSSVALFLCVGPFPPSSPFPARAAARAVAAALGVVLISCGRAPAAAPPGANAAPAVSLAAGSAVPHGDHAPHHGGVVMMKGEDLHYEIVLDPAGRSHRVYFTDAVREDLPASIASEVVLTIKRPSAPEERVALQIDETGESWVGIGKPVDEAAKATARVAFSIKGEAYWIDVPFNHP